MKSERPLIQLGPSTRLTPRVDARDGGDACLSAICKEDRQRRQSDAEELTCLGLGYLERIPKDEW